MPIINNIIPERIQNKTMEKEKLYWINGYLTCAMKDNNLPYGIEYLNFLADKQIEAEQCYNETFGSHNSTNNSD